MKQEPPGRSTNSTAGPLPTASRSRSPSASVPHPSFETGVSAPSIPVIAMTAVASACATAAWDTITPCSSLIIFFEVRLHPAFFAHAANEPLVERIRRIHAAVTQQMIHGDDFADHGQILARVQRDGHERELDVEQRGALLIES